MKGFQLPSTGHEAARQPIEQFGVGRGLPHQPKIAWGAYQTLAKMVLPDSVCPYPGRQWVVR